MNLALTISPSLRSYRKKAAGFKARGLTTKGLSFKRRPNALTAADRLAMRRERGLRAWNKLARSRRLAGLTVRGKLKTNTLVGRQERMILLSEVEAVAAAINAVYAAQPQSAQARCLELANHLAALRLSTL